MANDDVTINETLEVEHKEVTGAITSLSDSGTPDEDLFIEILDNLTIINLLKTELIYPIIDDRSPEIAEQARSAFKETDNLMQELAELHPSDEMWMDDLIKLGSVVQAMFSYEEATLLPILAEALTPDEQVALATKWDQRFDEEVIALSDELAEEEEEEEFPGDIKDEE